MSIVVEISSVGFRNFLNTIFVHRPFELWRFIDAFNP